MSRAGAAWTEAESCHDLSHHADIMHGHVELHQVSCGRALRFGDQIVQMDVIFAGLDGYRVSLDDHIASVNRVMCRWHATGAHGGDRNGAPAAGGKTELGGMTIWELGNGTAQCGWSSSDGSSLMAQLSS